MLPITPISETSPPSHLLIVDDEPEIAESLADYLVKKEGFDVSITSDGEQAISFLESTLQNQTEIDLVLLDSCERTLAIKNRDPLQRIVVHEQRVMAERSHIPQGAKLAGPTALATSRPEMAPAFREEAHLLSKVVRRDYTTVGKPP